ncbi:MAG: hypothetical protein IK004_02655 [Bacteroidales bacterium]|nr:hypothetical protein [Bacteroidales bacterium]
MKTVYKVLQGMMVVSLLILVIASCNKDDKSVVVEIVDDDEEFVDLGLTSGTLWKNYNEGNFYTYNDAISTFGDQLPSDEQFYELIDECTWDWEDNGYIISGPNGNSIFLKAEGKLDYEGHLTSPDVMGFYWSSTAKNDNYSYHLQFSGGALSEDYTITHSMNVNKHSIRLVK